jgi:hypothetical protein
MHEGTHSHSVRIIPRARLQPRRISWLTAGVTPEMGFTIVCNSARFGVCSVDWLVRAMARACLLYNYTRQKTGWCDRGGAVKRRAALASASR